MPRSACFDLHCRPAYGFEVFDCLFDRLQHAVDRHAFTEILAALEDEGRHLDADALADELLLGPEVTDVVHQLAAFGDQGGLVHVFGAVHVARITSGSLLGACDLSTFLLARRHLGRAPYDVVGSDWRRGYLTDETMLVQVSSTFYPRLRRWYEVAAEEWASAHRKT